MESKGFKASQKMGVGFRYGLVDIYIPIILYAVLCFCVVMTIIFAFFIPLRHWESMERDRKKLNIPITKWEYAQYFIIWVLTPLILIHLGIIYLIDLLNLEF